MADKTERQEAKRATKLGWADSAATRSRERGKQAVRKASRQGDIAAWGSDDEGDGFGAGAADAAAEDTRTPEEREVARVAREAAKQQRLGQQATATAAAELAAQRQQAEDQQREAARAAARDAKTERKRLQRRSSKAEAIESKARDAAQKLAAVAAQGAAAATAAAADAAAADAAAAAVAEVPPPCASSWSDALEGQQLHLGILLPGAALALWCAPTTEVVAAPYTRCVYATVVHQLGATLLWRLELHANGTITRLCRGNRYGNHTGAPPIAPIACNS